MAEVKAPTRTPSLPSCIVTTSSPAASTKRVARVLYSLAVAGALIVAVALAVVAWIQRQAADSQRQEAVTQRAAAEDQRNQAEQRRLDAERQNVVALTNESNAAIQSGRELGGAYCRGDGGQETAEGTRAPKWRRTDRRLPRSGRPTPFRDGRLTSAIGSIRADMRGATHVVFSHDGSRMFSARGPQRDQGMDS